MNIRKFSISALAAFVVLLLASNNVVASDEPSFPTCSNPGGTVIASYAEGIHGIVGSTSEYSGSDVVYNLGDNNVLQCFCADNGSGIQTNWWRVQGLTSEEIESFKKDGWEYIANGGEWGLAEGAYLAKNLSYACKAVVQHKDFELGGPPVCNAEKPSAPIITSVTRNGTQATLTWTKVQLATHYVIAYGPVGGELEYGVPNTGNSTNFTIYELNPSVKYDFVVYAVNDCMPSDPSGDSGYSGQVLGWASTGNIKSLYLMVISGIGFIVTGRLLRAKKEY